VSRHDGCGGWIHHQAENNASCSQNLLVQGVHTQHNAAIRKTVFVKGDRLEIDVRSLSSDVDAVGRGSNSWSLECDGLNSRTILHEPLSSTRFTAAIMEPSLTGNRTVHRSYFHSRLRCLTLSLSLWRKSCSSHRSTASGEHWPV